MLSSLWRIASMHLNPPFYSAENAAKLVTSETGATIYMKLAPDVGLKVTMWKIVKLTLKIPMSSTAFFVKKRVMVPPGQAVTAEKLNSNSNQKRNLAQNLSNQK